MTDKTSRGFNPDAVLGNIGHVKDMISRIRQKDGGVGSEQDELCLHRVVHDIDLLADMVAILKAGMAKMQEQAMQEIASRDDRIKELENPEQS